ncbi:MAG: alpha/beta hydrolase [Burkholderiaceae bacterium]
MTPSTDSEADHGPLVWRNLTQQALDNAYDQSVYAPNRLQILNRYHANSDLTRQRLGAPRQFRYGQGGKETLDVFSPPQAGAPVNVFIHGGAWRSGTAAQYAFLADLFVNAGMHLVLPDFDWVQDRNSDLLPIADQVHRAIAWVAAHAGEFGGDSTQIYLSGHSSGAHFAGAALTSLPPGLIRGSLLCSGMYELEPVSLSARSSYVNFSPASLQQLSPMRVVDQIATPLVVAYGDHETPEFQRQSQDFFDALKPRAASTELIIARGYNHFEVLETMASPYGLLGDAVLRQMLHRG